MQHARDSFLKFLASRFPPTGGPTGTKIVTDPEDELSLNNLSVFFLNSASVVKMNPGLQEMVVSLDVLADGTAGETATHHAMTLASMVNKALSGGWIKKQDWTDPENPVDLKTFVSWRPWGDWRRVPEPNERYAHLNRTISLIYIGEAV
jgi:hypothetical protein